MAKNPDKTAPGLRGKIGAARVLLKSRVRDLSHSVDRRLTPERWSSDAPPDFLIIGLQKCGTSWVVNLLNQHPRLALIPTHPGRAQGIAEGHFFDVLAHRSDDPERFLRVFSSKHGAFFKDLVQNGPNPGREGLELFKKRYNAFLGRLRTTPDMLVGDKTTEYVFHLDLVDDLYPAIKKICILRDPRDRAVSFHFHEMRKGRRTNDAPEVEHIKQYCVRVEKELRLLVDYPGGIHFLTFEELSSDAPAAVKGLLAHLEVRADDALVDSLITGASFMKVAGRKQGQTDRQSHYRKGVVGDWKNHLTPAHEDMFRQRINPLVDRLMNKSGLDLASYKA